jgi:hypothetical protein
MSNIDEAKVEVLKVWYSVFCTLVDAWQANEYDDVEFISKMLQLRSELIKQLPEVEEALKKEKI